MTFDPEKYLGTWYQIAHYPSYFEGSASYNTTAVYKQKKGYISVKNSSIIAGTKVEIKGKAIYLGDATFNVAFPPQENSNNANYIVDKIWKNYKYAVVTNEDKSMLFVLSRTKNPSTETVNAIFEYLKKHFDVSKIVMTPHY